jgi:hypothetical protein
MQNVILTPVAVDELVDLIASEIQGRFINLSTDKFKKPEPFIKGIHELAKFLRVSPARAQKLKNEGVIPYWQDGRTLLFDPEKVREAMSSINSPK